jgi:hypothetical protein
MLPLLLTSFTILTSSSSAASDLHGEVCAGPVVLLHPFPSQDSGTAAYCLILGYSTITDDLRPPASQDLYLVTPATIGPLTWRRFSDPVYFPSALCEIEGKHWTRLPKSKVLCDPRKLGGLSQSWELLLLAAPCSRGLGPAICCACLTFIDHARQS